MSEKAEIPVEQLQKVNLKKTETIEKQVLPSAEGKFRFLKIFGIFEIFWKFENATSRPENIFFRN